MKLSTWLKIIPIVFLIFVAVSIAVMFITVSSERRIRQERDELSALGEDLLNASNRLTENARHYVQFGEDEYRAAYYQEVHVTKTRDRVLHELIKLNAPQEEIELLEKAKAISTELELIEMEAFNAVESGDFELAREIMYGEDYKKGKQPIIDTLILFQNSLTDRCDAQINAAKSYANIAMILFAVLSGSMIAVTVFIFVTIDRKIKGMTEMTNIAVKISEGDFDLDFSGYESKDEFGMLAKVFRDILGTVDGIENEISLLVKDTSMGNLGYRSNTQGFKGKWSRILTGLNTAVETVREQIIENAPVAYAVVRDNLIVDCNRYAIEHIGMSNGINIELFYADLAQRQHIFERLLHEGMMCREQVSFRVHGGDVRRFDMFVNAIDHEGCRTSIIWVIDIEDEERKNDFIRRSQNDLQKLIDALPTAMLIEDPVTKKIDYANMAFYRMMEIDKEHMGELTEKDLYAPSQSDGGLASAKEALLFHVSGDDQSTVSAEFTYKTMLGELIETRVTAREILYNGKRSIIKTIHDIGDEKLQKQSLQNAADHEREANQLKSRFLANMSHEIRTPMNAIIGFSQIALMRDQEPYNVDTYRKIYASAKNLLTIINDILDFSKIEAQKIEITEDVFVLEDIVSNAFLVVSERVEDKRVEMLLDMAPDLPVKLVGDKTRLWQILKNLLDNSAKYTESGSVILEVLISGQESERILVTFMVTDTGVGMNKQQLDSLFEPFSQFDSSLKSTSSGTGLGMAITKQLVDLMGGSIDITSEPGVGTQISVTIGFKRSADSSTLAKAAGKNTQDGYSVLIADDDPFSCEIMQRMLETAGFSCVCVYTGKEALDEARRREKAGDPFNIVILDYMLGEDNGIDIGRQITNFGNHSKLLMVSAYVKKIPDIEIREAGFKDVLRKPVSPSVLIKCLRDTIGEVNTGIPEQLELFRGANVLVCEDNALNKEIALEMLRILGIEADTVADGMECLQILERKKYDLILMDILMPVMDGKEATRKIRGSDKPYKDICIIAMTADAMIEQVSEFLNIGMNGHIPKPIEFDVLRDNLSRFLSEDKKTISAAAAPVSVAPERSGSGFTIDGIAVSEGVARFGGNEARYKKALKRFAGEERTYPEPDTSEEFHRFVHTLKGVTGNLGITRLFEMSKTVEAGVLAGKPDKTAYEQFIKEIDAVCKNINSAIPDDDQVGASEQKGSRAEYEECLARLREGLKSFNPSECEKLLTRLMSTKWTGVDVPNFAQVLKAVEHYDFTLADELMSRI